MHQPAYTQTPNAWPKAMHLLLYDCASAREYTDTKRMAKSHASTAIRCMPKAMHLLSYDISSARVYTDTKRMAKSHASTAIRLCISPRIHRHLTNGLKPCIYCQTIVYKPANTQTQNAWPKAMHLCHTIVHQPAYTETSNAWPEAMHLLPYDCASASVFTDTKHMA